MGTTANGLIVLMVAFFAIVGWLKYYFVWKPLFDDLQRSIPEDITVMRKEGII